MFLDIFKKTIPHNQASKFEQLRLWFFSNLTFLEHYVFSVFYVVYRVINGANFAQKLRFLTNDRPEIANFWLNRPI